MKIVFDTVVLVRGLIDPFSWSGTLIFERADAYEWVLSPEIAAEYLDVLSRPRVAALFRPHEHRDREALLARVAAATIVQPTHVPTICRDPADDKFLAVALLSNADFIVTEDKDLLSMGQYQATRICTVEELRRALGHGENH